MSWRNVPNLLTLSRIAVIPCVFLLWEREMPLTAATAAALAASTDFYDGRLARAWRQETRFGAIADPVADKLFIMAMFLLLYGAGILPGWLVWLALFRNMSQLLAIPVLVFWKKIPFHVKPKLLPKVASASSFVILIFGLGLGAPASETLPLAAQRVFFLVQLIQGSFEIQIATTYWPRFFQILTHRHDTFE